MLTRDEVAQRIDAFLGGTAGPWDWDDFLSIPIEDAELDRIRARCDSLSSQFPPLERGQFCGPEGMAALRSIAAELRA